MFRLIGFCWLLFLLVSSEVFAIAVEDALPAVSKDQVQSGQLLFEQANSKAFLQAPMLQSSAEINIKGIVANVNVTVVSKHDRTVAARKLRFPFARKCRNQSVSHASWRA